VPPFFFMVGKQLRQYLVTASLGRGGMGEVWLARDTTLGREVAIKTLPAAGDADAAIRKERFLREARAASALNHPNIITIYEINSDQDIDFIAMEYVAGRTLADLLQQGPLAIDQVRRIASQIAEAVGRAHSAGIVHRDLKPRNIMVGNKGLVKVLDFGLAKMMATRDADATANVATQLALTRVGTTVGTVGYMSPEQAIGDAVDARSDVFSFGVILYEMLTGRLPFSGETISEVLRQLHFAEPPPLDSLRAGVPEELRDVVTRALRKRPDDRYADMGEVANALSARSAAEPRPRKRAQVSVEAPAAPMPPRAAWRGTAVAVGGALVLGSLAGVVWWRSGNAVAPPGAVQPTDARPVQAAPPIPDAPPPTTADRSATDTAVPRPSPEPTVQRVDSGATSHLHWGRLGDAYRTEPGQQANATAAYRRALELVERQIADNGHDPDLGSWRALYLAKLGDRARAVEAIEPLSKRTDLTAEILFRMAVIYELAGARQRALMGLARAVRAGYPPKEVLAEPELTELRSDPRFQRLANAGPAKKRTARR
jgi:serine/threonine-protein kinase